MGTVLGEAILKIGGDPRSLYKSVGGLPMFGDKLGREFGSRFRIGLGGAIAALGVTGGVTGAFAMMYKEAFEARKAVAGLEQTLRTTKGASGQTIESLKKMASELQKVTDYSDDAVMSAQQMLLTFTSIRGDVFPKATEAVLDMATVMGGDLKGAAIQVGKALNDPIRGVSALQRVGVSLTEQQKEQVKALVEAGRAQEAQMLILNELAVEFGGQARAQSSSLVRLKNSIADLAESAGAKLLPMVDDLVASTQRWIDAHGEEYAEKLGDAFEWVAQHKGDLWETAKAIAEIALAIKAVGVAWSVAQAVTGLSSIGKALLVGGAARAAASGATAAAGGATVRGGLAGAAGWLAGGAKTALFGGTLSVASVAAGVVAVLGAAAVSAYIGTWINKKFISPKLNEKFSREEARKEEEFNEEHKRRFAGNATKLQKRRLEDVQKMAPGARSNIVSSLNEQSARQLYGMSLDELKAATAPAQQAPSSEPRSAGLIDRALSRPMSPEEFNRLRIGGQGAINKLPRWRRRQYEQLSEAFEREKQSNPAFKASMEAQDAYRSASSAAGTVKPKEDSNLAESRERLARLKAYARSAPMNQFQNFSYEEIAKRERMVAGMPSGSLSEERMAAIMRMGTSGRMDAMRGLTKGQREAYRLYAMQQQGPGQQMSMLNGGYGRSLGLSEEQRRAMLARAKGLQYHQQNAQAATAAYRDQQAKKVDSFSISTVNINVDAEDLKDVVTTENFGQQLRKHAGSNMN